MHVETLLHQIDALLREAGKDIETSERRRRQRVGGVDVQRTLISLRCISQLIRLLGCQRGEVTSGDRFRDPAAPPGASAYYFAYTLSDGTSRQRIIEGPRTAVAVLAEDFFRVPRRPLSWDELQRQLGDWDRPSLPP